MIPDRKPNRDDPVTNPYHGQPRTANNEYKVAEWLRWRLDDPELPAELRAIMEVEALEADALGDLLAAMEKAAGDTLEEKMRDPKVRDQLKERALDWLRMQGVLLAVTANQIDHRAAGNGG